MTYETISKEHQEELAMEAETLAREEDSEYTYCEVCNCRIHKEDVCKLDNDIPVCKECRYNE